MSRRCQPSWNPPVSKCGATLKLYNSLTRQKEVFVPQYGNRVLWYSCGPTVYDASHMGHARSYISFDILRRVLSDYFGYDILYVMNITDIDDKIIKRARQQHLYEKYIEEDKSLDVVLEDGKNVMSVFEETVRSTTDTDKRAMLEKMLGKVKSAVENLERAVHNGNSEVIKEHQHALLVEAKDPLSEWLDKRLGTSLTENALFNKLSQHWEIEYHKDMDALNVLRPNVLTRVSEYVPEIIAYIERIMERGLAYESNGSVYFDVGAFDKKENHHYAKLVPEAYGDASSLEEGEGDLCISEERLSEKRSPTDFALWKSSKAGEPWWESRWGKGRPGWHIECSVMASVICGESLDMHTGGVDLKFPHHDNEIAQAEAYFDNSHWVKYFLHSGHLTISGCKMSKSLKNFITIQEALKRHTSRQLRLAFLLHSWKDTLDYSDNTMDMAVQYEKFLNEFFLNVKCQIRSLGAGTTLETFVKWNKPELELNKKLSAAKDAIHTALCDNIDTRTVLDVIRELVGHCNIYIKQVNSPTNTLLLRDIAVYITKIFTIFGAITTPNDGIGFPIEADSTNFINVEETVLPYLNILGEFREKIRCQAKTIRACEILQECDRLRDQVLPNMGVRLEDDDSGICRIKLVNRDELLKEREIKKRFQAEKNAEKEKKKVEAVAANAAKEALKKIPPTQMFTLQTDKYSTFDDNGLPTHDAEGKEITKGQLKKLIKLQQAQQKKYQEYLAGIQNGA
ncbi:cysteine--tRNA ligase, cytoplasmic [Fopius arisanus]|uniref:Cysteine--tRNA ligase, cytoplasmic n=2 Tax=Fopius arisanus TaxID=64838 RepID=A0A0C9Q4F6_9HYME|nr:PREDICTED: cysteine--tRNA ligase, cytoplasmic [Fopius arisanus]